MAVFILPEFIEDLQSHADANFAKRVLQKCLAKDGSFRDDSDDHKYKGMEDVWIKYVSRASSAYRVIFVRKGSDVYLYRAGEHAVEDRLVKPDAKQLKTGIKVAHAEGDIEKALASIPADVIERVPLGIEDRFLRNNPSKAIHSAIFGRRNLPHRDIWLVSPYITPDLLNQNEPLGKLLFAQVEDGASVTLVTRMPSDEKFEWMERLEEKSINVIVYPKLHSKLYCFVLDENRKYERGLPAAEKLTSLLLIGSPNVTARGFALSNDDWNEEICYSVPPAELEYVESYMTELVLHGFDMQTIRSMRARGQLTKLEGAKW